MIEIIATVITLIVWTIVIVPCVSWWVSMFKMSRLRKAAEKGDIGDVMSQLFRK